MGKKIPLPAVIKTPDAKAHPFPIQIGFQTYEFLQGVLFYAIFSNTAAGAYVRLPDSIQELERELISQGISEKLLNDGWSYLRKYQYVFENSVFQNVLILMRSH